MDPMKPGSRREMLHNKVEAIQAELRRAAAASILQNDPLSGQMTAVANSIGSLADIYEATEDTLLEILEVLRNANREAPKEVIAQIQAAAVSAAGQLTPRMLASVEKMAQDRTRTLRLRTLLGFCAASLVIMLVAGCLCYGTGFSSGRIEGELASRQIDTALAAGPAAASAWASLMADNNGVAAITACRKAVSQDASGRRYCLMPVWLDPMIAPHQ